MTEENKQDDEFLKGIRGTQIDLDSGRGDAVTRHSWTYRISLTILILIIAGCLGYFFMGLVKRYMPPRNEQTQPMMVFNAYPPPEPAGSAKAKVKVIAVIPTMVKCQKETCELIRSIAEKYPDMVHAEFYDMMMDDGAKILREREAECSTIFVNGKFRFTIKSEEDNGTEDVCFSGSPNAKYDLDQIVTVIKNKIKEAYGKIPEDFDTFAKKLVTEATKSKKDPTRKWDRPSNVAPRN